VDELLKPVLQVAPRPDPTSDRYEALYVRAFLAVRALIGLLGVLLPVVLVFADDRVFGENPVPRDSLSRYYYSGVREWFVGTLAATGAFLVAYKASERSLDNLLSVVAGAAAALIALFPTGRPAANPPLPLTPLQNLLGEPAVKVVHFAASGVFIVSLGVLSVTFGIREGRRQRRVGKRPPDFWRLYHFACAATIGAALLWIAITMGLHVGPRWSLLVGEWVSAWAFGLSWALKGLEMDTLFGRPKPVAA
jgi:hypothetical protein